MTDDLFTRLEQPIIRFIKRWWVIIILLIGGIVVVIFSVSIFLVIIGAYTGYGMADANLTERYNAHLDPSNENYVSEEEMRNWNDLAVPVLKFALGFLENTMYVLLYGYVMFLLYIIARTVCRYRNRNCEYVELVE